jgi:thioredoxin reductase (NADPH)
LGRIPGRDADLHADERAGVADCRQMPGPIRRDCPLRATEKVVLYCLRAHPQIIVHTRTEIGALEGDDGHLERVRWRDNRTVVEETHAIRHVFIMAGAAPSTRWLDDCLELDEKGFVKTGASLSPDELVAAGWPLTRAPHLLETSLPGVFAVGDVRSNSIRRVASAVGEGSIAIAFVHQVLQE